jgi:Tfp pilus assembly protein PilF
LIYLELGDYDQALDLFQTSVRLKPDYQDARVGLATLYENQSEYALASAQYKYILEHINPQDGVSIEKLSKLATQSANIDPK